MDFIADQLRDGQRIKVLKFFDEHTFEAMATEV